MDIQDQIRELRDGVSYVTQTMEDMNTRALDEARDFTSDENTAWQAGVDYIADAEARAAKLEERASFVTRANEGRSEPGFDAPNVNTRTGSVRDPFDLGRLPMNATRSQVRGHAERAIEAADELPDWARENATNLLRRDNANGALARHILATGSTAYRTGWQKVIAGAQYAITPEEGQAIEAARALSLTNANGGFAVPFTLDTTIIDTRDGTTNPFREISTVRQIVTDQWNGVTSNGMTVSWDGEAAEVSDDSPTLGQPSIDVHKAQGFAVASIEISQDWAMIESDLRTMIANAKDDAEAAVHATGTGSDQPIGIVTALTGTGSEVSSATTDTFAVADVYALDDALPDRHRRNATWVADRPIYNLVRQFDTAGGSNLWVQLGGGRPSELLGYPVRQSSEMDSVINATADNRILVFGDFRSYVIVDRVGLSVEFIPHLFGTGNNRPTGQRGWYAYWRTGADSVNDGAFRMLNVT